jgi:predicted AAA+ superfamily ATPase
MKQLLRHCLSAPASLITVSKIVNDFHSRGLKLGKDTLYRYLDLLEDAFFIFLLPIVDRSVRKQAINPKKMHLIDWAIGYTYTPQNLIDRAHKLENAIFLHERRREPNLGYLAAPSEIDLVSTVEYPNRFINVCWSLTQKSTREREVAGLLAQRGKRRELVLVAHDIAGSAGSISGVKVIEAWRFLLKGPNVEAI